MGADIDGMSVGDLRAFLKAAGADTSTCFEKARPVRRRSLSPLRSRISRHHRRPPRARVASLRTRSPRRARRPRRRPRAQLAPIPPARDPKPPSPSPPPPRPPSSTQDDLVALAKKVERTGAGSSASSRRAAAAGASSSSSRPSSSSRQPEPHDPNAGRGDATPAQLELVRRVQREKDYYALFGVDKGASDAELKKAYRKLALQLHPDKNTAPGAEEAFKKVNKAWDVLSDKNKRATYDTFGAEAAEGRGAGGFGGAAAEGSGVFRAAAGSPGARRSTASRSRKS